MACRKCGSKWVTATGKDCNRCPHCDKLQLWCARQAGRWVEPVSVKQCVCCGRSFDAIGPKQISQRVLCGDPECAKAHRNLGKKRRAAGIYVQQQIHGNCRPQRFCKRCGAGPLKRKQEDYCCRACFVSARSAGLVEWDTTNQRKSAWHRLGPYASAPSARLMRRITKAHAAIEWAGNALCRLAAKELARPTCENCGDQCKDGASRFCSYACNKAWRGERQCKCGVIVPGCTAFGPGPSCVACKRKTVRAWKRLYGKDTRKRVRKGGGYWNPKVRALAVFKRDKWICYLCKARCEKVYDPLNPLSATLDHVWPVSRGGDHDWHNVRTACAGCNAKKGNRVQGQRLLRFG